MLFLSIHDWSYAEVARISDPSGKVDAVLIEENGGATVSFAYEVHVLPKGKRVPKRRSDAEVASFYAVGRSESAYGVDLKWEGTNSLVAEYLSARGAKVLQNTVTVAGHTIGILI